MSKQYLYYKVSPRGFINEVTYYRVPMNQVDQADEFLARRFQHVYEDGGFCEWTRDKVAHMPDVAIDWTEERDA